MLKGDFIERETDENKVIVIGDIKLSENEERVLSLNPKYGVYTDIEQEDVEKELEVAGIKSRWDMRNNPEHYEDLARQEIGPEVQVNAPTACEQAVTVRQVFDYDTKSIRFSSKRATDYKQNSNIYLPRADSIRRETEISIRKGRLMKIAEETREVLEKENNKAQNLDKDLRDGIKSLKKRSNSYC